MMQNDHDRARELVALSGTRSQEVAEDQQVWLQKHLEECNACKNYADAADRVVRSLRSLPIAADSRLVRATQMRVRFHAARLRETRERMWLIAMASVGVGISAVITAPLFWRLFAWMGGQAGISSPVWQAAFAFFWIAPALAISLMLLARGTHAQHNGEKNWK
ncbi:MAG TPA: hypothetical protein VF753_03115 [Terriglobales bacterium]